MKRSESYVGQWVVYYGGPPGSPPEDGEITQVCQDHAFVRYRMRNQPQATQWSDLEPGLYKPMGGGK